jgi:uncharacterized protein (DUF305 family)
MTRDYLLPSAPRMVPQGGIVELVKSTNAQTVRTLALIATPLALVLALAGCAERGDQTSMPGMDHGGATSSASEPADEAGDYNAADSMFAMMMIPHHQQAVEMSDMLLSKDDVDPQTIDLAQQIKDAQAPEIELMQSWLSAWGVSDSGAMEGMDHGDGMMSDEDMSALETASGSEAAELFLEQMIEHHEGAIDMAESHLEDGLNVDALALSQAIIDTQRAEVALMQDMLADM